MNYRQRLLDEMGNGLKKKPRKKAKIARLVKLDKYLTRLETGK